MRRFITSRYSYILSRENRGVLDFCTLIVYYILCFCFNLFTSLAEIANFTTEGGRGVLRRLSFVGDNKGDAPIRLRKFLIDTHCRFKIRDISVSFVN